MMFKKLVTESREVVADAREIAAELASPTVEAEHLLLAVARQPATTAHHALVEAGLDYDQLREALAAEFEQSLAAAGISLGDFDLPATGVTSRTSRWGTSAKLALARSAQIADARHDRRLTPGHILLGVLKAPTGTVPRALDWAAIDRTELSQRVEAAL
jgi:ATP-dependent Clp protease ATP-binding subunit ClpA